MNLSALGTHFKSAKKETRVIIAPADDVFLATEGYIVARLTEEQLPKVFARRDIWPEIPELGGDAMVYLTDGDEELDATERNRAECQPDEGAKVAGKWREWTDLLQLNPLTFTPWIQLFEKGLMAHLLRIPGGDYLYLDYDLVALFTSTPAKLRWYGTGPTNPVVLATEENELLGLIAPLDRSSLETLTPPDAEQGVDRVTLTNTRIGESAEITSGRGRGRKKEAGSDLPAVYNCLKCGAEIGFGAGQENAVRMIDERPYCSACAEAAGQTPRIPWVVDVIDVETGAVETLELLFVDQKTAEYYISGMEGERPGNECRARQATEEEEKSAWTCITEIQPAEELDKSCHIAELNPETGAYELHTFEGAIRDYWERRKAIVTAMAKRQSR